MKLVKNAVEIDVSTDEEGTKAFTAVASKVGTVNRNGLQLTPTSLEIERNRYPFLYNHGEGSSEVIGDVGIAYSEENNAYMCDFVIYDTHPNIKQAVENGAFNSVSVSYYMTDYEIQEDESVLVKNAIMNEVSLVSVPADPEALMANNAIGAELAKEAKNKARLEEIKKAYE